MSKAPRTKWKLCKLNELGFVGRGRSRNRPRNDPSLYGGPYPFFQTGDIKATDLYLSHYAQTYNEKGLAQSKLWKPGTLCITIAANIAETAILTIEGCFPDSVVGFVADHDKADVRFVKYYTDTIKLQMQNVSKGTTQDNLSLDKLLTFDILTPPLPVQRKIAAVLSAYDDLIENNTRRVAILEEVAQMIYREWFVHFRFPGHEQTRMVDSALGPIPEGWEVVSFTDIADVLSGGTPKTQTLEYWGGPIPFFSPRDIPRSSIYVVETEKNITELGLSKCNSKLYPPNTVFITARGTVGKVIMSAVDMAMNQTCYALQGRGGIDQYFVFLTTCNCVDRLKKKAVGAVFDTIITDTFQRLPVIKPPLPLTKELHAIVSPIFELILNLTMKGINLRRTRDLLLPRLISGELDVSELDIETGEMDT